MRLTAFAAGVALAALLASPLAAQDQPGVLQNSAPAARPALGEGVVAIVNDEIISTYDVKQRLFLMIALSEVKVNKENLPQLQQQALRSLVDERLQMQEMRRYDFKVDDSEIDAEIDDMAKQKRTTREGFLSALASVGVQPETLREEIRANLGWRYLVGGRYRDRAKIGADTVDQTLARLSASAGKPQYLIAEIYIDAAAAGGMDEAMSGAEQLVDQMIKGAPFPSVASQFSNAPTASSGGEAGWMIAGELPPEVEAIVSQMKPGQLSRPIPVRDGVWIVYLQDARSGSATTLVKLKQVAIRLAPDASDADRAAAEAKLTSLQPQLNCKNVKDVAGKIDGVKSTDLDETPVTELSPEFRTLAETMSIDQVSAPVRTDVGLHMLILCGKRAVSADTPDRDAVEQRLFVQQLTMLGNRWMRDLRNQATIEMR